LQTTTTRSEIFLEAAVEFVAEQTGLTLAPTTWRAERCGWWSGCLQLRLAPVRSVVITYKDAGGTVHTVADNLYQWHRTEFGTAELYFVPEFTSPALLSDTRDAVEIEIEAGFDDPAAPSDPADPELALPVRAKQAILMIAANWYRNRESVSTEELKTVPFAADALIWQLKVFRASRGE
jgi:uncharacterized phiE125 gp8 family phage protein